MQKTFLQNNLIKLFTFILLSISLFFSILVSGVGAFDSESLKRQIYEDYGITSANEENFNKFMKAVVDQESGGLGNVLVNEKYRGSSTASGYYQMTEKTLYDKNFDSYIKSKYKVDIFKDRPGKFRVGTCKVTPCNDKPTYFMKYTKEEQKLITMAMWKQKADGRGGQWPAKLKAISSDSNMQEKWDVYAYLHHGIRTNKGELIRQKDIAASASFAKHLSKRFGKDFKVDVKDGGFEISVGGVTTTVKFTNIEGIAKAALNKICNDPNRKYGLVGYGGGICPGDKGGLQAATDTLQTGLNWVIGLAFMFAVIMFFYAGFLMLTGESSKMSTAKTIFKNVVIGLILIASAWLLVDWIFTLFGVSNEFKFTEVG